LRVPPWVRIHRARCFGATAQVGSDYYPRLTVRRGHQPELSTVA
jgi:hypothetical protein